MRVISLQIVEEDGGARILAGVPITFIVSWTLVLPCEMAMVTNLLVVFFNTMLIAVCIDAHDILLVPKSRLLAEATGFRSVVFCLFLHRQGSHVLVIVEFGEVIFIAVFL